MRWRRFIFWLLLSLLVVLTVGLTWLWTADLGVFKPQIERLVTNATGRQLSIDGELSIDLGGTTTIVAKGIRFANPDWMEDPDMVSVGSAEVHLDLWSLVDGPVYLSYVDIDDVNVTLATDGNGRANWELAVSAAKETKTASGESAEPLMTFGRVYVDEARVSYSTAERAEPLDMHLASLRKDTLENGYLELELRGTINGSPVTIGGLLGPQRALFEGRDIDFKLESQVDTFSFTADGTIDDLVDPMQPRLSFTASGPDVNDIVRMLDLDDIGDGDISLAGSLTPTVDGPLVLSVQGNVGRVEIESNGEFSDLSNLEQVDIDLFATGPDISRFLALAGVKDVRETPFRLKIDATRDGAMLRINEGDIVFGEARLDLSVDLPKFPSIENGEIRLFAAGPDVAHFREVLGVPGIAEGPFSVRLDYGVVESGEDEIAARIQSEIGVLTAEGKLSGAADYAGSVIRFDAELASLVAIGSSLR